MMMRGLLGFSLLLVSLVVVAGGGRGPPRGGGAGHGRGHGLRLGLGLEVGVGVGAKHGRLRSGLRPNFYTTKHCPQAERIVREVTWEKVQKNSALGAQLLRVHYHDCFVKGCDASILLDTVGTTKSEKDAIPNLTLEGFEVIDEIKTRVEKECPDTVSCADILALAARDAVSFPFKRPMWNVLTGRKDGKSSLLSDVTGNLPSPFANFSTLMDIFSKKGLDIHDLVALSGAHTIGDAHCGAFSRRLFNFTGRGDADPSLDPTYAAQLRSKCGNPADRTITVDMDPDSGDTFDTHYFTAVLENQGLFQSDAALLSNEVSKNLVRKMQSPAAFSLQFAESMLNMGNIEVITGDDPAGEIRKTCRVVNQ